MLDLIWDLYSFDRVVKAEDCVRVAKELKSERLETVSSVDYIGYYSENIDALRATVKTIPRSQIGDLEKPIRELTELLSKNEANESKYQRLFERYPWILSFQHELVQDHRKLDDRNVPDFTAVRFLDKYRDILEIKSPFMPILRRDGELSSDFNKAWNQCERYLNFAIEEKDYLRRKRLAFDNPRCYLFAGYRLEDKALDKIRIKEIMNSAIQFLTYDDLITFVQGTVKVVRRLQNKT